MERRETETDQSETTEKGKGLRDVQQMNKKKKSLEIEIGFGCVKVIESFGFFVFSIQICLFFSLEN